MILKRIDSKMIARMVLRVRHAVSHKAARMTQKWRKLATLTALARRGTITQVRESANSRAPT